MKMETLNINKHQSSNWFANISVASHAEEKIVENNGHSSPINGWFQPNDGTTCEPTQQNRIGPSKNAITVVLTSNEWKCGGAEIVVKSNWAYHNGEKMVGHNQHWKSRQPLLNKETMHFHGYYSALHQNFPSVCYICKLRGKAFFMVITLFAPRFSIHVLFL